MRLEMAGQPTQSPNTAPVMGKAWDDAAKTQDEALAHIVGQGPNYTRLSVTDIGLILQLHQEGKTQEQIAQRLGKHQTSVGRVIRKLAHDSSQVATALLKTRAYRSAIRVARIAEKSRDESEALKAAKVVLAGAGVIQSNQQVTVNNAVLIAQPDKPETWGPGPSFIEAKVVENSSE
jgi:hypothetical protein